jgi:CheY-like chemotaxis protein
MHGGTVEACSKGTDQGSEFTIRLPLLSEGRNEEGAESNGQASPAGLHRVLIVEDNVPAAKMLAALVALGHHEVQVAHSGEQALDLAGSFHPDIVLLDLGLPGISGFDVAAELRARAEFAHARLVAVTGYNDDEQRRRTQAAGFAHHLSKPVAPQALQEVLR